MKENGFTLPEVLISLALLAVLAAATLTLLPGLMKGNTATRDEQRVTLVGKSFFEQTGAQYARPDQYDSAPPAIAGQTSGLNCQTPTLTPVSQDAAGRTVLQRVTISCTLASRTYTLQHDYARP